MEESNQRLGPTLITDSAKLDAPGNFRIVFKLKNEQARFNKTVEQTGGFLSIREASIAMQRLIESREYTAANVLGARVIDLDNFPDVVAFITYGGYIYESEPTFK